MILFNLMTHFHRTVGVGVAALLLGAAAVSPLAAMRATVDQVLTTLKDPTLDPSTRTARVVAAVRDRFDFPAMAQSTLATNWREATQAQRDAFVERFTKLLEVTYLGRIDAYHDEVVLYDQEQIERDRALVTTRIHTATADIPIHYKLHQVAGEWRVYDVVIEQVSLVRNYRTTFGEIAHKAGVDGLLVQMDEKIRALQAAPARPATGVAR